MDFTLIHTTTGKTVTDFTVPPQLMESDPELVQLILESESMDDGERQYWFNLTQVMKPEQLERLRGILTRERDKLAEIRQKYGKTKPMSDQQANAIAQSEGQKRVAEQAQLQEREAESRAAEAQNEDDLLSELDSL